MTETSPTASSRSVLVVDDTDGVREVAQMALEDAGYAVVAVDSGERALEVIGERGEAIAVVVLDLNLMGMSGQETFRELRRRRPDLPVVLMSGFGEGDALAGLPPSPETQAFLQKPFRPAELQRAVGDLLDASGG